MHLFICFSASLFPLKSVGANDVVSGLVSLMATLDALLSPTLTPISNWEKSPVFAWLDGESWVYTLLFLFSLFSQ